MSDDVNENVNPVVVDDQTPADVPVDDPTPTEEPNDAPAEEPKEEPTDEPAEEPKDDGEPDEPEDEPDLSYNDYEDPALRQAVKILKDAKVPVEVTNKVFGEAVETGDLSKIDVELLKKSVGDDQAEAIMVMAGSYFNTTFTGFSNQQKAAYEITGGEENYTAMKEYAAEREKTDPEFAKEMKEIRALVDTGSEKAIKAAVTDLFNTYKNDPNTTIEADLMVGDSKGGNSGIKPLSRLEHGRLIQEAINKGTYEKEKPKLWAMRQEGIKQNIN